jgi:hypothetical protein
LGGQIDFRERAWISEWRWRVILFWVRRGTRTEEEREMRGEEKGFTTEVAEGRGGSGEFGWPFEAQGKQDAMVEILHPRKARVQDDNLLV